MSTTHFEDYVAGSNPGTLIASNWLNDVDFLTYNIFGGPNTVGAADVMWVSNGTIYEERDATTYISSLGFITSDTTLTTEQVQDIAGALVATGGTKTGITITYQDSTNDIDFEVAEASTTNKGIIELATLSEINSGSDSERAITPAGLALSDLQVKVNGIETNADVTDATNVNAAGATMNTDTDVSGNSWVLDEDNMSSDSNTKVPTQQSVKAYIDALNLDCKLLASGTATSGSSLDIDLDNSNYTNYRLYLSHVDPAVNSSVLHIRTSTDGGSTFDSGTLDYAWHYSMTNRAGTHTLAGVNGDDAISLTGSEVGTSINEQPEFIIDIINPGREGYTHIQWTGDGRSTTNQAAYWNGGGHRASSADVDAIQVYFSGGDIDNLAYSFYGFK